VWIANGPLSGALLKYLDRVGGLAGWQWVFLVEGLPAVVLGVVTFFYLTDRPEEADWLTNEERTWLTARLAGEEQHRARHHGMSLRQAAADRRVWHLIALDVTIALGISGLGYYFPPLIQDRFPSLNPLQIGLLTAVSGTCTLITIITVGWHSDRTGERRWHVAVPAFLAAVGWGLSTWREAAVLSFLGLVLAQAAMMSTKGPFWALPTAFLSGRAAVGGIALINAIGNLGAFLGPNIMGWLVEITGSFTPGLVIMALTLVVSATLAARVRPAADRWSTEPALVPAAVDEAKVAV
jgi:MFS transporter, ACS family, tartrate transporter